MKSDQWRGAFLSLAGALLTASGVQASEPDDGGRSDMGKWIETRRLLSQEQQEWRLGKEVLADRVRVVQKEAAALQ